MTNNEKKEKLIKAMKKDKDLKKSLDEEISHMSEMLVEYLEFAAENELKSNKLINPIVFQIFL